MFKQEHRTKPSVPLKNSERRKLRAQVVQDFNIQPPEDGDLLVPEGLHSSKFTTSSNESGTVYIDPSTTHPLWFTIGKSTRLVPTVYTLWKRPLLVCMSTLAAAVEKVAGGADLMVSEVVSISYPTDILLPKLPKDGVVSDVKGKAVTILHAFGDALWAAGSEAPPPGEVLGGQSTDEPREREALENSAIEKDRRVGKAEPPGGSSANEDLPQVSQNADQEDLSAADTDSNIRQALLQAVAQTIPDHPHAVPCTAGHFLVKILQPSRPHLSPPLDLKKSSFKTLAKFLKTVEKEGLLKLKGTKGEAQAKGKEKMEGENAEEKHAMPMTVLELWKPCGTSLALFEAEDKDISTELINAHIGANSLVHPRDAAYIVPDDILRNVVRKQGEEPVRSILRNDLLQAVLDAMQPWHSIEGASPEEGAPRPILTQTINMRSAGEFVTRITGFGYYARGPYASDLRAERLSEDLSKLCATPTTADPTPGVGKGSNAMEVVLQGKHSRKVADFLMSKEVPKSAIEEKTKEAKKKRK
ncbi:hypothetical protein FRB93_007813 [Tulasnella sp. JGI-2019a]|nr:hypothetical protein FRB93_007813 [Tulasnella sp. JGI-2019a]